MKIYLFSKMTIINLISIIYLTIGVLILLLGILIFRENPNKRINKTTGIMLFFAALGPIMGGFGILLKEYSATIDINLIMLERIFLIWEFFFPLLLVFAFIFPNEKSILKDYPKLTPLLFIPHVVHFIIILIFSSPEAILSLISFTQININFLLQPFLIVLNLLLTLISYFYEFHTTIFAFINLVYVVLAIFIMYQGYRELTDPRLKKQVGLVLWGIRVSVGLYVITFLLPKFFPIYASENLNYFLTILALLIGPGSVALAIIKYQFLDIRLIIRRGIIFSVTSGLLVGIYLLIYANTKRLFTAILGVDLPIVEVLFLVLAVIIFHPILSSIEDTVEKFFGQARTSKKIILDSLSHEIIHIIDTDNLIKKVSTVLKENLILENVTILLNKDDENFVVENNPILLNNKIKFHKDSEFITFINGINESIKCVDLLSRITNQIERQKIQQLKSYLLIPLKHHDVLCGILSLGKKITKNKFTTEELNSIKLLADQITITVENIALYDEKLEKQRIDKEISVAREIQRMLLPHEIPQGRNYNISAINISSTRVGGDYYDFVQLNDHLLGIAIADISGKGIPGALLMSNLQATLRAVTNGNISPAKVTAKINNQITQTTSPEKFATFLYGIFDTKKLIFKYTNAGHNYPILRKIDGECSYLTQADLIIGVSENYKYNENKIQLKTGDTLVFYTDGITEAIDSQQDEFSEQHLLDIVAAYEASSAENLRNYIYEEVLDFTKGQSQYDDITLIVLQVS